MSEGSCREQRVSGDEQGDIAVERNENPRGSEARRVWWHEWDFMQQRLLQQGQSGEKACRICRSDGDENGLGPLDSIFAVGQRPFPIGITHKFDVCFFLILVVDDITYLKAGMITATMSVNTAVTTEPRPRRITALFQPLLSIRVAISTL